MLMDFGGVPLYYFIYKRLINLPFIDQVVVATSTDDSDLELVQDAQARDCAVVRGSLENVHSRFIQCIENLQPNLCVRLCGDSPFFDACALERLVVEVKKLKCGYGLLDSDSCAKGFESEVFHPELLNQIASNLTLDEKEHVTLYIRKNIESFNSFVLEGKYSYSIKVCDLTVDTQRDYDNTKKILEALKNQESFDANEVLRVANQLKDKNEITV